MSIRKRSFRSVARWANASNPKRDQKLKAVFAAVGFQIENNKLVKDKKRIAIVLSVYFIILIREIALLLIDPTSRWTSHYLGDFWFAVGGITFYWHVLTITVVLMLLGIQLIFISSDSIPVIQAVFHLDSVLSLVGLQDSKTRKLFNFMVDKIIINFPWLIKYVYASPCFIIFMACFYASPFEYVLLDYLFYLIPWAAFLTVFGFFGSIGWAMTIAYFVTVSFFFAQKLKILISLVRKLKNAESQSASLYGTCMTCQHHLIKEIYHFDKFWKWIIFIIGSGMIGLIVGCLYQLIFTKLDNYLVIYFFRFAASLLTISLFAMLTPAMLVYERVNQLQKHLSSIYLSLPLQKAMDRLELSNVIEEMDCNIGFHFGFLFVITQFIVFEIVGVIIIYFIMLMDVSRQYQ